MAIISKITVQKKAKQRYNLFIQEQGNDRYAFSVDEDILIKYGLRKGQDLNEEEMRELVDADEAKKTQHLAVHYLSYRMRSEKEMYEYLIKKERQPEHITKAIDFLKQERLIDDTAFAGAFVRTKTRSNLIGPNKVKQQLIQKGVQESVIDAALHSYDIDWQIEVLSTWLKKQAIKGPKQRESTQQLIQKRTSQLVGKGFAYEAIHAALSGNADKANNEDEWQALVYQAEKLLRTYTRKYTGYELKQKLKQALYRKGFAFSEISRYIDEELQGDEN